jgi:hypothetical protein
VLKNSVFSTLLLCWRVCPRPSLVEGNPRRGSLPRTRLLKNRVFQHPASGLRSALPFARSVYLAAILLALPAMSSEGVEAGPRGGSSSEIGSSHDAPAIVSPDDGIADAPAESVSENGGESSWRTTVRGYLLTRAQAYLLDNDAVLSNLLRIEPLRVMHELNVDASAGLGNSLYFASDVSALLRLLPKGCAPNSADVGCVVVNELYAEWRPLDFLRLLVGRHRATWGNAITFQFVESQNALPDPTEPLAQRLGVWMGLAEVSVGEVTGTVFLAPEVRHMPLGLPASVDALYGTMASRLSWRSSHIETTGFGYWDYGLGRVELGAQAALFGFDGFELHAQALVHNRREIQTGELETDSCRGLRDIGIPHRDVLDVSGVAGIRYDLTDGSMLGVEYVHNGDGITAADFRTTLTTIAVVKRQCPNATIASPDLSKSGRPSPLSNVLLGRNYVFLTGLRPSIAEVGIFEDVSAVGTVQLSLDDFSLATNLRLTWTYEQRAQFRIGVLIPLGVDGSQLGILPFDAFLLSEIQVSF